MKLQTIGVLALGPSGNIQGGIRCYSLLTGKILHCLFHDVTFLNIPEGVKRQLRHIVRNKKAVKGLIFGDCHNNLDPPSVITGVTTNDKNDNDTDNHTNCLDESESNDRNEDAASIGEHDSSSNSDDSDNSSSTGVPDIEDDSNNIGVSPDNWDKKFPPPGAGDSNSDDGSDSGIAPVMTTRWEVLANRTIM